MTQSCAILCPAAQMHRRRLTASHANTAPLLCVSKALEGTPAGHDKEHQTATTGSAGTKGAPGVTNTLGSGRAGGSRSSGCSVTLSRSFSLSAFRVDTACCRAEIWAVSGESERSGSGERVMVVVVVMVGLWVVEGTKAAAIQVSSTAATRGNHSRTTNTSGGRGKDQSTCRHMLHIPPKASAKNITHKLREMLPMSATEGQSLSSLTFLLSSTHEPCAQTRSPALPIVWAKPPGPCRLLRP